MAFTPEYDTLTADYELNSYAGKTWGIDWEKKIFTPAYIDKKDAIRQAIYMILQTERGKWMIYNGYGADIGLYYGKSMQLAISRLSTVITEALLRDDRITAVRDFIFLQIDKNTLLVTFTVDTIEGEITIAQEVDNG